MATPALHRACDERPQTGKKDLKARNRKIAAFVVDRDLPASKLAKENKMGQRASNTTDVIFDEVRLPKEALLGQEGKASKLR